MLCTREEPFVYEPLGCCPPSVFAKPEYLGPIASSWVLQKVKDNRHYAGLSHDEVFEGELMALFTATKVSNNWGGLASKSKSVTRSKRELKRLSCSINYDSTYGNSS